MFSMRYDSQHGKRKVHIPYKGPTIQFSWDGGGWGLGISFGRNFFSLIKKNNVFFNMARDTFLSQTQRHFFFFFFF